MKRKTLLCAFCAFLALPFVAYAQQERVTDESPLVQQISVIKEKQDKFNFYMHTHMSADQKWGTEGVKPFTFNARELRMEARGNVTERFSYRLMYRLNVMQDATRAVDGQPGSLDVAGIGIKFNKQWSAFLGRQCAAYGGIQFDYNPVQVYEYVSILNTLPIFLTGVKVAYEPVSGQQFQLQVLNSQNDNLKNLYQNDPSKPQFKEALVPLDYTFNWNGKIVNCIDTRWSYSYITETDRHATQYIALGNLFHCGRWEGYFDAMFARVGLNAGRVIPVQENGEYHSYVLKAKYSLSDRWKVFAKGMYETAGAGSSSRWGDQKKELTTLSYVGGVEYYPMPKSDLHFFLVYTGKYFDYTSPVRKDFNTNRLSLGFIWQIPVF